MPDPPVAPVSATVLLPGISVFLPAHNEEANIERVVQDFVGVLPALAADYEVILVDDGSRDRTGEIADRMAAADPHVRVIHHPTNYGYGGAVVSGIRASRMPYVLLCDGDGQFDAADLKLLAARMTDYDVAAGYRIRRADPLMRRINGKAWTLLVQMLFGLHIRDIDCGFKLFRRKFLDGLELRAHGAMISTEVMALVSRRGARICEVGVNHKPRMAGEQSGNNFAVIARAFRELFGLYRELKGTPITSGNESV
jgi:glycosyltransferase involved in cell wall biosynthesis